MLMSLVVAAVICLGVVRPGIAQVSLDGTLQKYLTTYDLPALAAAVVRNGKVVAAGAVGTRRVGAHIPVTARDRFHLGSDTKAMTALLAAILVEEGKLRWTSSIAEVFPELADRMDPGLRRATLEQLLSHTSGIPSDNQTFADILAKAAAQAGNLDDLRYFIVREWSTQPLQSEPGTTFAYSNMGYTLAGTMLERAGGKTWEELVTERVFKPLGLTSAGFGPQATLGKVDAPLGHAVVDGKLKPFLAGPDGDNPLVLGPAGTSHMSVLDFARWAAWNAGQGRRGPKLVRPDTLRKLHTPVISMPEKPTAAPGTPARGKYALGWGEVVFSWAPEPFLFHGGSNQKNLAYILLQPRHDFGMVLMTNISGPKADQALQGLAEELYRSYAGRR
jgi:CubicO group peptidase (beta-lactamase class C family)